MSARQEEVEAEPMSPSYGPYIGVDGGGRLQIDGCDAVSLAREFGMPLWVISERTIRHNYRTLAAAFREVYPNTRLVYATKANPEPAILRILKAEGALVDAITMGHLRLILKAGYRPDQIILNGNNKTLGELEWALANRVGEINVDSVEEMQLIADLLAPEAEPLSLSLRLAIPAEQYRADDPDFAAYWKSSKFGMDVDDALTAAEIAARHPALRLSGVHNHRGYSASYASYSAEKDLERHGRGVEQTVAFAARLRRELGITVQHLNLGGGYRVGRPEGFGPRQVTTFPSAAEYARVVGGGLARSAAEHGLPEPRLLLEPGGYLVADAVALLGTVGFQKLARGWDGAVRWVFLDNATAYHFVRRLSSNFYHHVVLAQAREGPIGPVNLAGPACSVDAIATDMSLPPLERGDVVAVLDQGAYCEAITSDFCAIPIPAAVLACAGVANLVRRRQTVDDILERYLVPERLIEPDRAASMPSGVEAP